MINKLLSLHSFQITNTSTPYSRRIYTNIPETISENYKNAIRTLEQLKKGVITLESSDNQEVKSSGEYRTNKTVLDRLFNKRVINSEY